MKSRQRLKKSRPRPVRPHLEELEARLAPSTTGTSTNWSGYAVQTAAGAVTSATGSWVVPTVTGTGTAYSSTWVGIDGFSSSTVEQIGTDSDVVNGQATYYAWYEMYPSATVKLSMKVKAGDTVAATVSYSNGAFTLTLRDTTQKESFSIAKSGPNLRRSSAEWIEEAPSSNFGVLPLANFGKATFTNAQATINGTTGPIDGPAWSSGVNQINMASNFGTTEATTGSLSDSGSPKSSSFTVTYVPSNSGTTPPHHRRPFGFGFFAPNQAASGPTTAAAVGASGGDPTATSIAALNSGRLNQAATQAQPAFGPASTLSAVSPPALQAVPSAAPLSSLAFLSGASGQSLPERGPNYGAEDRAPTPEQQDRSRVEPAEDPAQPQANPEGSARLMTPENLPEADLLWQVGAGGRLGLRRVHPTGAEIGSNEAGMDWVLNAMLGLALSACWVRGKEEENLRPRTVGPSRRTP